MSKYLLNQVPITPDDAKRNLDKAMACQKIVDAHTNSNSTLTELAKVYRISTKLYAENQFNIKDLTSKLTKFHHRAEIQGDLLEILVFKYVPNYGQSQAAWIFVWILSLFAIVWCLTQIYLPN
eukprot:TRINITY_DN13202_c0_g1_i1.p2 TRINITY_DN13202_c0_g1~~TRINITY_DN13202_c0_g1_i1.p2  ORF type:complete len:123 (+),score=19.02 TRINITY_DN13202_c0_g1_i1:30-398(+)